MPLHLSSFEKALLRIAGANDKFIVAASGGVDSMVICELLRAGGFLFEIAHINFQLRGAESDDDQLFLQSYSKKHKIPFHLKKFNTLERKKERKKGTQEVARELRYNWLEELRVSSGARYIVTGHHGDDQAETILFHFLRGSGPSGLAGMAPREGKIIRPLLNFSRDEILSFARKMKIGWREDSSNRSVAYTRNKIRLRILPQLESINPGLRETLRHIGPAYHEASQIIQEKIGQDIRKNIRQEGDSQVLSTQWLSDYEYKHLLLWEILKNCQFSFAQVEEVLELLFSQSGKHIFSSSHEVLRNRNTLLVSPITAPTADEEVTIAREQENLQIPVRLAIQIEKRKKFTLLKENTIAQLDIDLLDFPLRLRKWKKGDRFKPLGMKGSQKVSDFLVQQKVTARDKDKVFVLLSGDAICWVAGYRISDDFKVGPETQRVWVAQLC